MVNDRPVIARHRKLGTGYVEVVPGGGGMSMVTTVAGSKYVVKSNAIVPENQQRATRAELERELKDLVRNKFKCGGWRIEQGIMPVVVLTIVEARDLAQKLERGNDGTS